MTNASSKGRTKATSNLEVRKSKQNSKTYTQDLRFWVYIYMAQSESPPGVTVFQSQHSPDVVDLSPRKRGPWCTLLIVWKTKVIGGFWALEGLMSGASERAGNLSWFKWILEGESQTHRQRRGWGSKHLFHVSAWTTTSIVTRPQTSALLVLGLSDSDWDCIYPPISRPSDSDWIIPLASQKQETRWARDGTEEISVSSLGGLGFSEWSLSRRQFSKSTDEAILIGIGTLSTPACGLPFRSSMSWAQVDWARQGGKDAHLEPTWVIRMASSSSEKNGVAQGIQLCN